MPEASQTRNDAKRIYFRQKRVLAHKMDLTTTPPLNKGETLMYSLNELHLEEIIRLNCYYLIRKITKNMEKSRKV